MRFPIRYQFVTPLALVAAISLLTVAVVYHRRATQQTRDRVQDQLRGVAEVLTQRTYPLTEVVLRQMAGLAHAEFVLTNEGGVPIASSDGALIVDHLPRAVAFADQAEDLVLGESIDLDAARYLHSAVRVRPHGGGAGRVLHILFQQSDYDAAWRSAFLPPLFVGLATIAVSTLVVHTVAGRVSGVLSKLGGEVGRLSSGDFSDVEQPTLNDETRDLAALINQTAGRLRDYENELKRTERLQTVAMIGAGLAHEMRNAVTGCRLAIDLHAEASGAADDESLDVARRQLKLMEGQLQKLLRVGKTPQASNPRVVDFAALVGECVELVSPAARHRGAAIEWSPSGRESLVVGDPESLGQAVTNVLLNALEAAAKPTAIGDGRGWVAATIMHAGGVCELRVTDDGDGPANDSGDIFEPFVTDKPEGGGLGLAVARRAVEAHSGSIGYHRESDRTVFCIRVPLADGGERRV